LNPADQLFFFDVGTFLLEGQGFPVEEVSSPADLKKKISGDPETVGKSRDDAVHAAVLGLYQEIFPGLEGCYFLLSEYAYRETDKDLKGTWQRSRGISKFPFIRRRLSKHK